MTTIKRPILTFLTTALLGLASAAVFAQEPAQESVAPAPQAAEATLAVADLSQGQAAFNAGDYGTAFKLWRQLAEQGHNEAQVFVGLAYANGWGVDKDMTAASEWYQKAAEQNNPSGQFLLGLHYLTVKLTQNQVSLQQDNTATGLQWLRKAAANGDTSAQKFLDKAKARHWFDDVEETSAEAEEQQPENLVSAVQTPALQAGPL